MPEPLWRPLHGRPVQSVRLACSLLVGWATGLPGFAEEGNDLETEDGHQEDYGDDEKGGSHVRNASTCVLFDLPFCLEKTSRFVSHGRSEASFPFSHLE